MKVADEFNNEFGSNKINGIISSKAKKFILVFLFVMREDITKR